MKSYQVTAKAIPAQGYCRGGQFWLRDGSTHILTEEQLKACQKDRDNLAVIEAIEIVNGRPVDPPKVSHEEVAEKDARIKELEELVASKSRRITELEQQIAQRKQGK